MKGAADLPTPLGFLDPAVATLTLGGFVGLWRAEPQKTASFLRNSPKQLAKGLPIL